MLTSGTIAALVLIPLGALLTIAAVIFIIAAIRHEPKSTYDDFKFGASIAGGVTLLASLPMLVFPLIGLAFVNFDSDYMAYKPVTGTVEQVASRQIADGKGMSQRYVFQIDGKEYGVDDTRAALVKEGDSVGLNCTKEFVWGSTNNGYACNWGVSK